MTTYGFHVSITNSDGQGEWSQAVSILVRRVPIPATSEVRAAIRAAAA